MISPSASLPNKTIEIVLISIQITEKSLTFSFKTVERKSVHSDLHNRTLTKSLFSGVFSTEIFERQSRAKNHPNHGRSEETSFGWKLKEYLMEGYIELLLTLVCAWSLSFNADLFGLNKYH